MALNHSNHQLEERVRLLFNAFNSELRAVIDGFLLERRPLTEKQLYDQLVQLVPSQYFSKKRHKGHFLERHLKQGLPKAKLRYFVEERTEPLRWKLSYKNLPHHDHIARFLLYMSSVKFNIGLNSLLGKSQADGPYTTVKLLQQVVENNVHSVHGLTKRIGISPQQAIAKTTRMENCGLLTYSSFYSDTGKNGLKYRWNTSHRSKPKVDDSYKYPQLSRLVIDKLKAAPNSWFTIEDLAEQDALKEGVKYHPNTITRVLRILQKKRMVGCNENWKSGVKISNIQETTNGREFYKVVIEPVFNLVKKGRKKDLAYIKRKALWEENLFKVAEKYLGG